jgi:hypothetical protein
MAKRSSGAIRALHHRCEVSLAKPQTARGTMHFAWLWGTKRAKTV